MVAKKVAVKNEFCDLKIKRNLFYFFFNFGVYKNLKFSSSE